MATRKKKSEESNLHSCVQCEQIGEINARLDGQESTDLRIETSIRQLADNYDKDRKATTQEFTELKCEIVRVGTALENSVKNSEQLIKNQTEMLTQMKDLAANLAVMGNAQENTKKLFEKHIHESDAWRTSIERRVSKLERTKWFWYTLAGLIVAGIGAISYLASIYDVISSK